VPGVLARPPVAAGEAALDAGAGPQREAVPRAEQEQPQAAEAVVVLGAAAEPRPVAASAASQQEAASAVSLPVVDPSAAPWAFHRVRVLPSPVRRRAARSARAMFVSQAASPSERSWQAARCEGLS